MNVFVFNFKAPFKLNYFPPLFERTPSRIAEFIAFAASDIYKTREKFLIYFWHFLIYRLYDQLEKLVSH